MHVRIVRKTTFRESQVLRLRTPDSNGEKATYKAIGEMMGGLSKSRLSDMYRRAMSNKVGEDVASPIEELSIRTMGCLQRMENSSIADDGEYLDLELLRDQFDKGIIAPHKIPNFGRRSYNEVKELINKYRYLMEWSVFWNC